MRILAAGLLLLASASLASAQPKPQAPALPALTLPVNDFAAVIDEASARDLDAKIRDLKTATGDVVIVTTVPSVAPFATVEEYAVKLFEKAGIGDKKLDNGLLILVAVKEHGVRIEVGYGLEGIITDGFAGDTIRSEIVPQFKQNRYGPGLVAGTTRLMERIREGRAKPEEKAKDKAAEVNSLWLGAILFVVLGGIVVGVIVFVIYLIAKKTGGARSTPVGPALGGSRRSRDDDDDSSSSSRSSSSDSSSSFDGFSGGSSGGGGASGSW